MALKRQRAQVVPTSATTRGAQTANVLFLTLSIVVAAFFAWLTRQEINPDGVAYLDLARALGSGSTGGFVQGYWSPLYPALLALVGPGIAAAHAVNALVALVGALLLFLATRRMVRARPDDGGDMVRVSAVWCAWFVAAFVLIRISAVTPDMILLTCIVGWVDALTNRSAPRWARAGLWLGLGFLAKTSLWPWMLVTTALLAWRTPALRVPATLARFALPMVALMLAWLGPLSIRAGRPTLGVTGALNACWFLRACDGQSPDTHTGTHTAYQSVTLPNGAAITRVRFPAPAWTYAPWSDPDTWSRGVLSQRSEPLVVGRYLGIVAANLQAALQFSLSYMALGPLLAMALWWWVGRRVALGMEGRADLALLLAGVAGIAQFVAVQAVTRTLAPFALLCAAAITLATRPAGSAPPRAPWPLRTLMAAIPVAVATFGVVRVAAYEMELAALNGPYLEEMRGLSERVGQGFVQRTVLVVGPAIPLMPLAAQLNARIVGQVPPRSRATLDVLPPTVRREALGLVAHGEAEVAWEVDARGRTRVTGLR